MKEQQGFETSKRKLKVVMKSLRYKEKKYNLQIKPVLSDQKRL